MIQLDRVSDKIPRELIKERKHWHSHGTHVLNVIILIPGVWNDYVPLNFKSLICFSMGQEGHETNGTSRGGIPCCGGCNKPYPWFSHFCVGCGEFFIRDFFSPKFCELFPVCWNCLPELPWAYCPDHRTASDGAREVIPPYGLNPVKYTQEEIDDVFGPGFFD